PDDRLDRRRARARDVVVDRYVAPAEEGLPVLLDRLLDQLLDPSADAGLLREEHHAGRVPAGRRQLEVGYLLEQFVRGLEQDAGAVAGVELGARCPTVL